MLRPLSVALSLLLAGPVYMPTLAAEDLPSIEEVITTELHVRPHDELITKTNSIFGTMVERLSNGNIRFRKVGGSIEHEYTNAQIVKMIPAVDAETLLERRGIQCLEAFEQHPHLRDDLQDELRRLLTWERAQESTEILANICYHACRQYPKNKRLIDDCIRLLQLEKDDEHLTEILLLGLAERPLWDNGYKELARIYTDHGIDDKLQQLVQEWLNRLPNSEYANLLEARFAENNGDGHSERALKSYQKLWKIHDNAEAGLEYARLVLQRGESDRAFEVCQSLIDKGIDLPGLHAVAGASYLHKGEIDKAQELLNSALSRLSKQTKQTPQEERMHTIVLYNLGWIAWKKNNYSAARTYWEQVQDPIGAVALARLNRRPLKDTTVLENPVLHRFARLSNTAFALENNNTNTAEKNMPERATQTRVLLQYVLAMQRAGYDAHTTKILSTHSSETAQLWQAYSLIMQSRFTEAEKILALFPEDHGYAAVYRLFCAEGLGNQQRADQEYQRVLSSTNPPQEYVNFIGAYYYKGLEDEVHDYSFAWQSGEIMGAPWNSEAKGTGIRIYSDGNDLIFEGTQRKTTNNISRVWSTWPIKSIREISVDMKANTTGASGVELLTPDQKNGIAIAYRTNKKQEHHLAWRHKRDQQWKKWKPVFSQHRSPSDTQAFSIWIDKDAPSDQQIQIRSDDQIVPLTGLDDIPDTIIRLSAFVATTAGSTVDMTLRSLTIRTQK